MAAFLASDKALKESAQRAFISYIKSVNIMKNKNVFNVNSISLTKFAESLGLATTPRVRFLERQEKNKVKKIKGDGLIGLEAVEKFDSKDEKEEQGICSEDRLGAAEVEGNEVFVQDDDSEEDEDIFTVKRKDHTIDDQDGESEDVLTDDLRIKKSEKVLTKAQMAKKLMKKNIQANTKMNFDEEGEVISEATKQKQSKEGRDDEADRVGGGINIQKAKEVLKAEDKFDKATERARIKEKHKEDKRKQKEENRRKAKEERGEGSEGGGEESDYSEPDLSWLPDPDKIYGKEGSGEDPDESDSDTSDDEQPAENVEIKEGKRKVT